VGSSSPGDTIIVKAGSYSGVTINNSGTIGAWYVLKTNDGDTVWIQGGGSPNGYNFDVNGSYIRLIGFNLQSSSNPGQAQISIESGVHHVSLESMKCTNVCPVGLPGSGQFYKGAVQLNQACHDIYIRSNWFFTSFTNEVQGMGFIDGVTQSGGSILSNIVVCDCTFTGTFWDCLGSDWAGQNCDAARNQFVGHMDDSTELDGLANNVRWYGNHEWTTESNPTIAGGHTGVSMAPILVGPAYVFRNTITPSTSLNGTGCGFKNGYAAPTPCNGPAFIFHNTVIVGRNINNVSVVTEYGGPGHSQHFHYLNNIFYQAGTSHQIYESQGTDATSASGVRNNSYDYNLWYAPLVSGLVYNWNNGQSYTTLASFQAGTTQDVHSIYGNPLLNPDYTLQTNSPAIDRGVVIPNFNDASSAWSYSGAAPDIGAIESSLGSPLGVPTSPTSLIVTPQ
jgi:hypothetical protein